VAQCSLKPVQIFFLGDFNSAKAGQMVGHELTIEQFEPADSHTRDQICQCDLRRIGGLGKHAFAEKCPAHCEPVQSADKLTVQPAFHAMRLPYAVQRAKRVLDIGIDPGFASAFARLCAYSDNAGEYRVRRDDKPVLTDRFCQGF